MTVHSIITEEWFESGFPIEIDTGRYAHHRTRITDDGEVKPIIRLARADYEVTEEEVKEL